MYSCDCVIFICVYKIHALYYNMYGIHVHVFHTVASI